MTLLIALGVVAMAVAATLVSLRIVSQESELQGRERHNREAFFAAEAGLAEGREVLTQLVGKNISSFTAVFPLLGNPHAGQTNFNAWGEVDELGFPGQDRGWYELMPFTRYSLMQENKAVDASLAVASREMRDVNGKPFLSFPTQSTVFYRVFVHDDDDDDPNMSPPGQNKRLDSNRAVWLESVGEVRDGGDKVIARTVVRALVMTGQVTALSTLCPQANCTSSKEGSTETETPSDMTQVDNL